MNDQQAYNRGFRFAVALNATDGHACAYTTTRQEALQEAARVGGQAFSLRDTRRNPEDAAPHFSLPQSQIELLRSAVARLANLQEGKEEIEDAEGFNNSDLRLGQNLLASWNQIVLDDEMLAGVGELIRHYPKQTSGAEKAAAQAALGLLRDTSKEAVKAAKDKVRKREQKLHNDREARKSPVKVVWKGLVAQVHCERQWTAIREQGVKPLLRGRFNGDTLCWDVQGATKAQWEKFEALCLENGHAVVYEGKAPELGDVDPAKIVEVRWKNPTMAGLFFGYNDQVNGFMKQALPRAQYVTKYNEYKRKDVFLCWEVANGTPEQWRSFAFLCQQAGYKVMHTGAVPEAVKAPSPASGQGGQGQGGQGQAGQHTGQAGQYEAPVETQYSDPVSLSKENGVVVVGFAPDGTAYLHFWIDDAVKDAAQKAFAGKLDHHKPEGRFLCWKVTRGSKSEWQEFEQDLIAIHVPLDQPVWGRNPPPRKRDPQWKYQLRVSGKPVYGEEQLEKFEGQLRVVWDHTSKEPKALLYFPYVKNEAILKILHKNFKHCHGKVVSNGKRGWKWKGKDNNNKFYYYVFGGTEIMWNNLKRIAREEAKLELVIEGVPGYDKTAVLEDIDIGAELWDLLAESGVVLRWTGKLFTFDAPHTSATIRLLGYGDLGAKIAYHKSDCPAILVPDKASREGVAVPLDSRGQPGWPRPYYVVEQVVKIKDAFGEETNEYTVVHSLPGTKIAPEQRKEEDGDIEVENDSEKDAKYRYTHCPACSHNLPKGIWYTAEPARAAKCKDFADDSALAELQRAQDLMDYQYQDLLFKRQFAYTNISASNALRPALGTPAVPCPPCWDDPKDFKRDPISYLPYQESAALHMTQAAIPALLLADEMGVGKTISALAYINLNPEIQKILILAPAIALLNWKEECEKWLVRCNPYSTPDERKRFKIQTLVSGKVLQSDANILILNYEKLVPAGPVIEYVMSQKWDLLVADEIHYCKLSAGTGSTCDRHSVSRRALRVFGWPAEDTEPELQGVVHRAEKRLFMTGTPIPNRPMELWPLFNHLIPGRFSDRKVFGKAFCDLHKWVTLNGQVERVPDNYLPPEGSKVTGTWTWSGAGRSDATGQEVLPRDPAMLQLQAVLRGFAMIRRMSADVLVDLPPKTRLLHYLKPDKRIEDALKAEAEAKERFGEGREDEDEDVAQPASAEELEAWERIKEQANAALDDLSSYPPGSPEWLRAERSRIDSMSKSKIPFKALSKTRHTMGDAKAGAACAWIEGLLDNGGMAAQGAEDEDCEPQSLAGGKGVVQVDVQQALEDSEPVTKLVVFAYHETVLDTLESYFLKKYRALGRNAVVRVDGKTDAKQRQAFKKSFQTDPNCRLFLGQVVAVSTAITLTAANHVVFVEQDWVPGTMQQAECRCWRLGQKKPVFVHYLVANGSIDSNMAKTKLDKMDLQDMALNKRPSAKAIRQALEWLDGGRPCLEDMCAGELETAELPAEMPEDELFGGYIHKPNVKKKVEAQAPAPVRALPAPAPAAAVPRPVAAPVAAVSRPAPAPAVSRPAPAPAVPRPAVAVPVAAVPRPVAAPAPAAAVPRPAVAAPGPAPAPRPVAAPFSLQPPPPPPPPPPRPVAASGPQADRSEAVHAAIRHLVRSNAQVSPMARAFAALPKLFTDKQLQISLVEVQRLWSQVPAGLQQRIQQSKANPACKAAGGSRRPVVQQRKRARQS